jgi:4-hydroxy-tetrahydrodipicolinate synthase
MTEKKYSGVVVPMVTPVTASGALDEGAVRKIVESFAQAGVSPLLMGTTGEGNSVSAEDGVKMVRAAVETAQHRITIYAGLTGTCYSEQLVAADNYDRAGADVIVATLPSYYALTDEQMYNYYESLANAIKRPLMLYNIKATTHMSIPVDVVRRLSEHPNIVGLKDSERDLERMAACIEISKNNPRFSYFCGWAAQSAYSLSLGGDGIVPSTGNFVPAMFRELYDAALKGDTATANRLQEETNAIAKIYQEGRTLGQSLTALKVMMQVDGLCDPYMLLPLTRLPKEEEEAIAARAAQVKR